MAAGTPATTKLQIGGMIHLPDVNLALNDPCGLLHRMALETKIIVALHKHFCVHGSMGTVTDNATLPQRLMLEDERA